MAETDGRGRLTTADRIYGGIAIVAIVLAIWFLGRGGGSDTTAVDRAPRITISDPVPGATRDQPLVVTFDARSTLRPDGSAAGAARHVHAQAGGTMLMPGTTDIMPVKGTTYRWTLPKLPAGPTVVQLYWADATHRPIPGASSDSVPVTLR